jgi:hypothetical protein
MFTGEIVMGESKKVIDVVFDTGSDWLVIPDSDCISCKGQKYNSSESVPVNTTTTSREYGSAYLEGKAFSDTVCLDEMDTNCVANFTYFAFHYQKGLNPPVEGILGLSLGY